MVYSVCTHSYGSYNYDTFDKVMEYMDNKFFNGEDGSCRLFMRELGAYLDGTKYPCDKMVLCAFIGYNDRVGMKLMYHGERVAYIEIAFGNYGIIKIVSYSYCGKEEFKVFHEIIEEWFDEKNGKILDDWAKKCGVDMHGDGNEVFFQEYVDYKPKGDATSMSGTIAEIFDSYTTWNDRLRYCNGHHFRFVSNDIEKLYLLYVKNFKGNYFLANAVKRGVTID